MCEVCTRPIDGDYETPGKRNPFALRVRDGDIHIYSGLHYRNRSQDTGAEGNVILWEKERVVHEVAAWLAGRGEVRLGAVPENQVPEADTLEEVLRSFSIHGNLASYFPPVLARLEVAEVVKQGRALYIRSQAPGAAEGA